MIVLIFAALLAAALLLMSVFRKQSDPARSESLAGAWDSAMANENSQVGRLLLSVSRPISTLPQVHLPTESGLYKSIRLKLAASGGMFGGSVEVFLSVQIMTVLIAAAGLVLTIGLDLSGLMLAAAVVFSLAFAAMPYNRVADTAKKRIEKVTEGLPEFAELLLMPVTSGYGILPALDFTSQRLTGPVAAEVRLLLQVLSSRAADEREAFLAAGERLGTPAAITFFNTLHGALVDGLRVTDTLRSQAEQLRKVAYERTRAKLKALPNKLVFIMGLHLLPFLFVVTLLPTLLSLGSMA